MFYKTLIEKEDGLSYGIAKQNIFTKTIIILTGEKKSSIKTKRTFKEKELFKRFQTVEEAVDGFRTIHIL